MTMTKNKAALLSLLEGKQVEAGERYYRYHAEKNEIQYSDDQTHWKPSAITFNDFLKWENWNIL